MKSLTSEVEKIESLVEQAITGENTRWLSSFIVEKIVGDNAGSIQKVEMSKSCPAAARERISIASETAKINEKNLKAREEALQSQMEKAKSSGDEPTAQALAQRLAKVSEYRSTNLKNMDKLESIASDYALKYKPKNDLYDQRGHALFLQKEREKLQARMKEMGDSQFPNADEMDKIKRRMERIESAQKTSSEWLQKNDEKWGNALVSSSGDSREVTKRESEKIKSEIKANSEQQSSNASPTEQKPQEKQAQPTAEPNAEVAVADSQQKAPGSVWKTTRGAYGAKNKGGIVKYFKSEEEAQVYSGLEKGKRRTRKPVASAEAPKPKQESIAHEILKQYLSETYRKSGLGKWFHGETATKEPGWDRYNTAGKRIGKCGDAEEGEAYAACLSKQKAKKLGKKGISSFVKRKRAAQKKSGMAKKGEGDAGGGDAPVRVSTGIDKVKEQKMYESVSVEEMKKGIEDLIKEIKKHEALANSAKKAGDMSGYKKHRGHIAEFSSDIKTIQDMIKRAMRNRAQPITEEDEDSTDGKALNKPFRTPGGPKKFGVYVRNDNGNIVLVRFGDPNMSIKRDNPDRLKAFRSRHSCDDDVGPKWKARYWSCQMWRSDKSVNDILGEASENEPTNPELWSKIQDLVAGRSSSMEHGGETIKGPNDGKGFDVHPSAYSNAWAAKLYKSLGGGWRAVTKEETESLARTIVRNAMFKRANP